MGEYRKVALLITEEQAEDLLDDINEMEDPEYRLTVDVAAGSFKNELKTTFPELDNDD